MEDTQWNDILRAHGILPPLPTQETEEDELDEPQNPLEGKSVDELKELEEEDALDDERIMEAYRMRRLKELKEEQELKAFAKNHGTGTGLLKEIRRDEFVQEVTEASKSLPVVLLLYKSGIPICRHTQSIMAQLSTSHPYAKFLQIIGDECIPGYPDRNLPTLLIYVDGDLRSRLVGVQGLGGMSMGVQEMERYLISVGALQQQQKQGKSTRRSSYSDSESEDFSD